MNSELNKALKSVKIALDNSCSSYRNLSDYIGVINQEMFLLDSVFNDSIATLTRVLIDNWQCEIEFQLEKNTEWNCLVSKLELLLIEKLSPEGLNQTFAPVSSLCASLLDNKGRDESGRPITGILTKQFSRDLVDKLLSVIICKEQPVNWAEWVINIDAHIDIIGEIIRHFPASHHFGSLPCSIAIMLRSVRSIVAEQDKLSNTLKVLTTDDSRGQLFHLDTLFIKQKLLHIPVMATGEEE
jgi:hypothetical protein